MFEKWSALDRFEGRHLNSNRNVVQLSRSRRSAMFQMMGFVTRHPRLRFLVLVATQGGFHPISTLFTTQSPSETSCE